MINLLLTFLLATFNAIVVPEIKALPDDQFIVTFEPGAVAYCTIFTQISGDDRPYEPHSCGLLDPTIGSYRDSWAGINPADADWDVYAEVQYETAHGIESVETNHLKVHR